MNKVLMGINSVGCFTDDVVRVGESNIDDCQRTLERVLDRLNDYSITLNLEKGKSFKNLVCYLGHNISSQGIYPT